MTGPVRIVDAQGVYPSALDAAIAEQAAYYAPARAAGLPLDPPGVECLTRPCGTPLSCEAFKRCLGRG